MEKQVIVALGREFGSGGHYVAQKIAKDLGLNYYDRKILEDIAEVKNIRIEHLEKYDEKKGKVILFRNVRGYTNSLEEIAAEIQFEYLRKKAATGESFVIVGRCADEIFRGDKRLISIFVLGDREDKIRCISEHHQLSRDEAYAKMKRNDEERKKYHNKYSETVWGDSRGYDICINSSKLGISKTADILESYIKERTGFIFIDKDK